LDDRIKRLKSLYENAYKDDKSYSGDENSFFTFPTVDVTEFILKNVDFKDRDVLEVGCGTGETAHAIAMAGAGAVLAIDYAEEAINSCRRKHTAHNLEFKVMDYEEVTGFYDVIVMQEVIEHLEDPEGAILRLLNNLKKEGSLVITCPNFTNIRGYIWMTLQVLFDVPMSLSDLHFFSPFDFEEIAERNDLKVEWTTFAHDRVLSEKLITDMRKRLKNALRDAGMDNSKVDDLMAWLERVIKFDNRPNELNGGKGFYLFSRR
jgi:SAM-dependent methyltransferase